MKSRKIALCGMLCALAVTLLALGGMTGLATFLSPLGAMAVLLPVQEECGPRLALTAYGAVAVLGLLLVADRELSLVYLFFGWYPVLRPRLQRIRPALLRAGAKLGIYLVTTALLWGGAAWVVGLPEQSAVPTAAVMTVLGCGLFFCADRCFAMFSSLWRTRLRRRFFKG